MFIWVDQRFERHLIEDRNFDSVKLIKLGFKGTVENKMAEQQARLRTFNMTVITRLASSSNYHQCLLKQNPRLTHCWFTPSR